MALVWCDYLAGLALEPSLDLFAFVLGMVPLDLNGIRKTGDV